MLLAACHAAPGPVTQLYRKHTAQRLVLRRHGLQAGPVELAEGLTKEFGSDFSERNLAYMRTFYVLYQSRWLILQSVTAIL